MNGTQPASLGQRFSKWFAQLFTSREKLEAIDEQKAAQERGTTPVANLAERGRASIFGVLRSVTYPAKNSTSSFSATLFDGTGSIEIVWLGRKKVVGIEPGVHLHVQGTVARVGGTLCILNPSYQIVSHI